MEYPFKDLMPLDEATARDGYYKDWTHIDADTFHQISELAKFIREKGRGADTREAIAQALERVYHDAAISGNANMEVSQARGSYPTLAERLGASDNDLRNISVNWINKNLGKLDQTYMSDEFLQQIAGTTPVNAVPADRSITRAKLADEAVGKLQLSPSISGLNNYTTELIYENGLVKRATLKNGSTPLSSVTLNFNANGELLNSVEIDAGRKVTTALNYTDGSLTSISNAMEEI